MFVWGAGEYGEKAIIKYGDMVTSVIDNSPDKKGQQFFEKTIISFDEYLQSSCEDKHVVICASFYNRLSIIRQLKEYGIYDYEIFSPQLFDDVDLVFNQYEQFDGVSEEAWNAKIENDGNIERVEAYVEVHRDKPQLFHEIEIETINRCNGTCSFCPVNVKRDIRKPAFMEEALFYKIVEDLHNLNYTGRVALFSNNEPFLDKRIIDFSKYLREEVPLAQIHLFTNGTLLSIDKFDSIIEYLDELIIDNYNQNLELNESVKKIKEHVEYLGDGSIRNKVKILLRKSDEYLSSRGGDAPNRSEVIDVSQRKCALPWCQMIVRPTGEVSLCCNDPYGKMTLGDLNKESLTEVWYGQKYTELRQKLLKGRGEVEHCSRCDTFMVI
ncbi:MAG: SPASM domain-containing protein [Lachnospiraceae bacterium]|nr:SPASM domain-containing protein [Lachnospiraceae bacterium]